MLGVCGLRLTTRVGTRHCAVAARPQFQRLMCLLRNWSARLATNGVRPMWLFASEGDVAVDFAGEDEGDYAVWVYAMRGRRGELIAMELSADNAGQVQVADADSAAVIVGRASAMGGDFTLAARYFTPTVVAMQAEEQSANDLAPAYPNPANSSVNLPFRLAGEADVELAIYNALGQRTALLVAERLAAGEHLARWSGERAASGAYWAVLKVGGETRTRRLMLVR